MRLWRRCKSGLSSLTRAKLTLTLDGDKQKQMAVIPDATVLLNGSPAGLDETAPGDVVNVETDEKRPAIPEASPTLPLAASLGLTFSYNVTVGIPVSIMISQLMIMKFPVAGR